MEKVFLIVDGNSIACRGAFVPPIMTTAAGRETGGTYRFFTMLDSAMKMIRATHVLVAWDVSRENFRTDIDESYKANRETVKPVGLYHQFEDIKEILTKVGIKHVGVFGYEGDDVLGTYANISEADKTFIFTGDKDSFQLINDTTTVMFPKTGTSDLRFYTREVFEKEYDIKVEQFVELKALMGDGGDNVKGITKCGQKTGIKLLKEYGSIEGVVENSGLIKGKIGENVREWAPTANKTLELVTIRRDVPVPYTFDDCEIHLNWKAAREIFTDLEFISFIKKLQKDGFYNG
ncbi:DNA polymerase I [compost metagenome]